MTNESALTAQPDVILVSHSQGELAGLANHPALRTSPAARKGHIFATDDTEWLQFGPRLGASIREFTRLMADNGVLGDGPTP